MSGPPILGKNVQQARKQKGLSLDSLAERSGVSKAMLSQLEKGKVNPTIGLLWKIAEGLHMQLGDLLAMEERKGVFQVKDRTNCATLMSDDGKCEIQILSPPKMIEFVELYLLHFEPDGVLDSAPHPSRTEEIVTAVQGRLEIRSGDRCETIEPFASVHYSADVPHGIHNVSGELAVAYLAVKYQ